MYKNTEPYDWFGQPLQSLTSLHLSNCLRNCIKYNNHEKAVEVMEVLTERLLSEADDLPRQTDYMQDPIIYKVRYRFT